MRQSQVDKLYAGLKDLSEERRGKLDERFRLFQLNREVDDLEQWIAEREVVAGSHELGQDYEHVTVSTSPTQLCTGTNQMRDICRVFHKNSSLYQSNVIFLKRCGEKDIGSGLF